MSTSGRNGEYSCTETEERDHIGNFTNKRKPLLECGIICKKVGVYVNREGNAYLWNGLLKHFPRFHQFYWEA